ncbi:esterase/lipase family protein [Thermodesulforhabdus norvegica]|uniref:Thioesterase domain-containing protein n=1 Tax=Thermodesulforhabdus norvegica TaxID=39841 RepID=A0A1I4SMC2_9BACT|nr:alpha/beta fold hydrolase [Thermodesulforhabdus norvegica]SFM65557.1 Thioesterase domain-containing protein [Thermodesulforhabdus norvegica]
MLCSIVVTLWLLLPAITYFLYWYEVASGGERSIVEGRTGRDLKYGVLLSYLTSLLTLPLIILTYPLGWFAFREKGVEEGNSAKAMVICIHGLFHNPSAWLFFSLIARHENLRIIYLRHNPWDGSFVEVAEKLYLQVKEAVRAQKEPVVFIGHSLGGLLAGKIALKLVAEDLPVSGVITIGTPFKGSKLTVFTRGRLARSLDYNSPLVLNSYDDFRNPPFPAIQYWSPTDNMVLPPFSLYDVPDGWEERMIGPMCHVACLFWPPLLKRLCNTVTAFSESRA